MTRCTFEGCTRTPRFPDQSRCEQHRLRWIPGNSPEARKPEWLRRMDERGLPAKDFTGHAA